MNSNITIAPNIYVRSSAIVQNDDEFVKRVYGHRALNILKTRFAKTYASRFTRAQIEEMKQNVICRHGKTREYAYGKALLPDGKVVWSCRCEHTDCHAYDSCMSLPNALRIVREGGGEAVTSKLLNPDEFDGKSIDDDVFEPPHVSIVLERLNEILTWNELDSDVNSPLEKAGESMPAECQGLNPNPENKSAIAEKFIGCRDKRVLVVCKNSYEAGYLSTILYKNKVRHRLQRLEGYTLSRKIADVFWDYCEETIDREVFFNRGLVRLGGIADYGDFDKELEKFYDALFRLCGDSGIGESGGLRVSQLADALNESPELISECVLNMDDYDFPVTVATLGQFNAEDDYDAVYALVGETPPANSPTHLKDSFFVSVEERLGTSPLVLQKESSAGWLFSKSALGRPFRISLDNYKGVPGRNCLNIEFGLWGDVDGKSFLADHMGDAIRLQLYIAEKIREGDELTVEKNSDSGGYWFFHDGNILAEVSDAIIRELRAIDGFPDDFVGFEGIYVRNIVTCVSEKNDITVSPRYRESRFWLGLDIAGYAKVLI